MPLKWSKDENVKWMVKLDGPGNSTPIVVGNKVFLTHPPKSNPKIRSMICFDREFPESAKLLALDGAELVLVPNACALDLPDDPLGRLRLEQLRARAWENLVAVALANYPAPQNDGHSVAYYPDGGTAVLADEREQIVHVELDLERVRAYREAEIGRSEARRPELYGALSAPAKVSPR